MPDPELDPRDTIDRKAEQELFAGLVGFATQARMLVISDKLDRGKSTLLRRLEYNCKWEIKSVTACLIDLEPSSTNEKSKIGKRLPEASPFAFVEKIVAGLSVDERFPKFIPLNKARAEKNFAPFETAEAQMTGQVIVKGELKGEATGIKIVQPAVVQFTREEFTDVQEEIARKKCVEAFFDDLRVLCATQSVVLLLDHWERCNYDLREWIRNTFMGNHCFASDKNLRPARIAFVVAGNIFDKAKERFGIRDREFIDLFKDEHEHNETVLSRASLSDWDSDHIREFLEQNGYTRNVSDEDIDYLRGCLRRGMTFRQIRDISKSISSMDA